MKTYQDLLECKTDKEREDFLLAAINEHKTSVEYRTAVDAELYARRKNVTIMRYQKLLYTISGKAVPDNYAANHKCASNFFGRFVTQQVQFLLGNGVSFKNEKTREKLGKDFDVKLQKAAKAALVGGCAFGFMNRDHVDIFKITEFVPLYDEDTGALCAGVRFWQIADDKPLRMTLYELDGYTEYIRREGKNVEFLQEKRQYKQVVKTSKADGTRIVNGSNYPSFPIVPLWANDYRQSELVGIREQIDCYDLIKSGFANDLDEASLFYWTLENCGGMKNEDIAKFIHNIRTIHAAAVDGDQGSKATAHTMEVPYESREVYLTRLEKDLYSDYMALDVSQISAGNVTATQINAAYEPLNEKADEWEYCVIEFIQGLLALLGVEDEPSFTRSKIVNQSEEIQTIISAGEYLDDEFIIERICTILGCADKKDEILARKDAEESARYARAESIEEDEGDDGQRS